MANLTGKTISELPAASALSNSDMFAISSGGSSKKATWETIKGSLGIVVDYGHFTLTASANDYAEQIVSFSKTFTSPPSVSLTLKTTSSSVSGILNTSAILADYPTTQGFLCKLLNGNSSEAIRVIYWIAVGV